MVVDAYLQEGHSLARLVQEYQQYGSLCIGVDFDGTLHDYHGIGESHEMVIELVRDLHVIGCKIIIWTANKDLNFVREFCIKNDIPYDGINEGGIKLPWESKKPFFSALLDDRAGLKQVYDELKAVVAVFSNQKQREQKLKQDGI